MATVNGYSAERMKQIEDESVIEGHVEGDTLILTQRDGTEIVAGIVQGPKGDAALPPNLGTNGMSAGGINKYVRVGVVDGFATLHGAQLIFDFNGGGNYGEMNVYSAKVHVGQRGDNNIQVEVFEHGNLLSDVEWYTKQLSTFVFEIWVKLPLYPAPVQLQPLSQWNGTVRYDSQDTAPTGLVSSGVKVFSSYENVAKAILDPAYRWPGPARVRFLPGGSLSTEYYQWEGRSTYWGNRVVNMRRRGNTWVITGENSEEGYGGKLDLNQHLRNGWVPYSSYNSDTPERWGWPRAQKLPSGIVVLSGLITGGTITAGTVLFNLPAPYRPDSPSILPINNGDTAKAITVYPNGDVMARGSWVGGTYVSLDGLAWPAAGVATWTPIGTGGSSWMNSWVAYADPQWGTPSYWKDPYGFVWFRGLISSGSTATDNAPMFTLPTTHQSHLQSNIKVANQDEFGFVSAIPGAGQGVSWKVGATGNAWISLNSIINVTEEAVNNNPWTYPYLANGWTRYSGSYPNPGLLRREDGLGMAMGLLKGGTAPAIKVASLPSTLLPEAGAILYGVNGGAFNRQDFNGIRTVEDAQPPGRISVNSGSNGWNSWDGHVWMVGD